MNEKQLAILEAMQGAAQVMAFLVAILDNEAPKDVRQLLGELGSFGGEMIKSLESEGVSNEQINEYLNQMLEDQIARFARFGDKETFNEERFSTIQ